MEPKLGQKCVVNPGAKRILGWIGLQIGLLNVCSVEIIEWGKKKEGLELILEEFYN